MEARTNRLPPKNPPFVLERERSTKYSSFANAATSLGSIPLLSRSLVSSDSFTLGSFDSQDSVHPSIKKVVPSAGYEQKKSKNSNAMTSAVPSRMELSLSALERVKREQSPSRNLALNTAVVDEDEDENHCSNDDSLSTIDSKEDDACGIGIDREDGQDEDHVAPSNYALAKQGDADSSSDEKRTKINRSDLPQNLPQLTTSTEKLEADRNRSYQEDNSFVFERRNSTKSIRSSFASNESSFGSLLLGNSMTSIGSFSSQDSMRPNKKAGPQAHGESKKKSNINVQVNAISQRMEQRLNKLERLRRESFEASSCSLTLDMIALDEEGEDETYSDDSLSTIDGQYDESYDSEGEGDGEALVGNADNSSPALVSSM